MKSAKSQNQKKKQSNEVKTQKKTTTQEPTQQNPINSKKPIFQYPPQNQKTYTITDYNTSTNMIEEIFQAKDEEIAYWKSIVGQLQQAINEYENTLMEKEQIDCSYSEISQVIQEIGGNGIENVFDWKVRFLEQQKQIEQLILKGQKNEEEIKNQKEAIQKECEKNEKLEQQIQQQEINSKQNLQKETDCKEKEKNKEKEKDNLLQAYSQEIEKLMKLLSQTDDQLQDCQAKCSKLESKLVKYEKVKHLNTQPDEKKIQDKYFKNKMNTCENEEHDNSILYKSQGKLKPSLSKLKQVQQVSENNLKNNFKSKSEWLSSFKKFIPITQNIKGQAL